MIKEKSSSKAASDILEKIAEPPMYRVVIFNDDVTHMDFVVEVLCNVFEMNLEQATIIMLSIHNTGKGDCGIYPFEIAETKVATVHSMASKENLPLKSGIEKA